MIRIALAVLSIGLIVVAASSPAPAGELRNDQQPTSCDCSNCSAEHCKPPRNSDLPLESLSFNYGKVETAPPPARTPTLTQGQ